MPPMEEEEIAPGKSVEVRGLKEGAGMNGSIGVAEAFIPEKERWKVKFASGVTKNFKLENLGILQPLPPEKVKKKKRKLAEAGPASEASVLANSGEAAGASGGRPSESLAPQAAEEEAGERATKQPRTEPAEPARPPKKKAFAASFIGQRNAKAVSSMSETLQLLGFSAASPQDTAVADAEPAKEGSEAPAAALEEASCRRAPGEAGVAADPSAASGPATTAATSVGVSLAGRAFPDRAALMEHIRALQKRVEDAETAACSSGGDVTSAAMLNNEDSLLVFHLALLHPKTSEKCRVPLRGIRYGKLATFPAKCFIFVFSDGTEEPVSAAKCVKEVFASGSAGMLPLLDGGSGAVQRPAARPSKDRAASWSHDKWREKTRAEKGLKLIGEEAAAAGHSEAGRWTYVLKDEVRRCFAGHLPSPFSAEALRSFYEKVQNGTSWQQPSDPRSGEPIPRKTAWMVLSESDLRCTYRYGGVEVTPQKFPPWMIDIMEACMPFCGLSDKEKWPDSCNLNLYKDGNMSVGWHADDEKLFLGRIDDTRIISLSLGATRTFELRLSEGEEDDGKYSVRLNDGDICTMEGLTQKYYSHRVPKEAASGARINLTWRWIRKRRPDRPVGGQGPAQEARADRSQA